MIFPPGKFAFLFLLTAALPVVSLIAGCRKHDAPPPHESLPSVAVPEALIGNVTLGAKLAVRIGATSSTIEGVVTELAPVAAAASRTFLAKLGLPPTEGARSVVEKPIARLRIVRAGKHTDAAVELLAGIASGESLVIKGAEQLRDGQPIALNP